MEQIWKPPQIWTTLFCLPLKCSLHSLVLAVGSQKAEDSQHENNRPAVGPRCTSTAQGCWYSLRHPQITNKVPKVKICTTRRGA